MQLQHFLDEATNKLRRAGIETARLDVLVLLEDVLEIGRAHLLAHPEMSIPPPQLSKLNTFIVQRSTHLPLAYIRGKVSFYGRNFMVNKHVLVPRPETESMIDLLKELTLPAAPAIVDVGTGSGCIGITAALEIPGAEVTMYDVDPAALEVTRQNAAELKARVTIDQHDLLAGVSGHFDVVMANLPYVPDSYAINKAAGHEPALALFSGQDGLDLYRIFWQQLKGLRPLHVITEALEQQHKALASLASEAGYQLDKTDGLAQLFSLQAQPQA